MAISYKEGETKIRPGIYQRYENIGYNTLAEGRDGFAAIPIRASWGPLGKVVKNSRDSDLAKNYGSGTYGPDYTVPAAEAVFRGGAVTVYTYRLGTGGAKASLGIATGMNAIAKYEGTMPLSVAVQTSLGDSTKKQLLIYSDTTLLETFSFDADGANEGANLIKVAADSKYIDVVAETSPAEVPIRAVASGALTGGADPVITNEDYSAAFAAFEPYFYNTITLDVDDDEDMTLSLLLQAYKDAAYEMGKLGMAVVGEKATVNFEKRLSHAKQFKADYKCIYQGDGYMVGAENKDGVLAIAYTAGVIAATPSNKGITHTVIGEATDLVESLTYYQFEEAINAGMLLLSMSPEGEIWYDSGVNTFTAPADSIHDEGWRKIRRVKVRFEMFDRLDRQLGPKVGRVSADSDGVADVIQAGQRVLDAMVQEGKLFAGATFTEDPDLPFEGDRAWFIIRADDIDSLEKIYLRYQFRYSCNLAPGSKVKLTARGEDGHSYSISNQEFTISRDTTVTITWSK